MAWVACVVSEKNLIFGAWTKVLLYAILKGKNKPIKPEHQSELLGIYGCSLYAQNRNVSNECLDLFFFKKEVGEWQKFEIKVFIWYAYFAFDEWVGTRFITKNGTNRLFIQLLKFDAILVKWFQLFLCFGLLFFLFRWEICLRLFYP